MGAVRFHAEAVAEVKRQITALCTKGTTFTPSELCKALGTTRRFVLPLLESLDRQGFTKRSGSNRTLV